VREAACFFLVLVPTEEAWPLTPTSPFEMKRTDAVCSGQPRRGQQARDLISNRLVCWSKAESAVQQRA
jgi:hypothetical protein